MVLVSVLMRCHDPARLASLKRAIQSVQEQTFHDWEAVLVQDGLLPGFEEVSSIPRVRFHQAPYVGRSEALNVAARLSSGYYISYLDDDDEYDRKHLETLVGFALKSGTRFVYGAVGEPGQTTAGDPDDWKRLLGGNVVFNCGVVHERSLFVDAGIWDPSLPVMEDWDMWLRMAAVTPLIYLPIRVATAIPGEAHSGPAWNEARKRILAKWGVAA